MHPSPTPDPQPVFPAYCMNVHPVGTLDDVSANLRVHARSVADRLGVQSQAVGIWIPRSALPAGDWDGGGGAAQAAEQIGVVLAEHGLRIAACNGFPFDTFHGTVIKERVYRPDWTDARRAAYTLDLARLAAAMEADHLARPLGISTVPVGWPSGDASEDAQRLEQAAVVVAGVLDGLERLEQETGFAARLEMEPEPGCLLDTPDDLVNWVERHLRRRSRPEQIARYFGACHDVCHASVMQQDQRACLKRYRDAGLMVSRLQISNALEVRPGGADSADQARITAELRQWAEPCYMHQTSVKADQPLSEEGLRVIGPCGRLRGDRLVLFDDLPDALEAAHRLPELLDGVWRVHFHVPLFLDRVGGLSTTQPDIDVCLRAALEAGPLPVVEAETYAWSVMPQEPDTPRNLHEDIAAELRWLADRIQRASGLDG